MSINNDDKNNGREREDLNRIDYSQRNRKLEWRSQWFHLNRTDDEDELIKIRRNAFEYKQQLIKRQRAMEEDLPLAGYSPAGPGTPWFSIGPRNINGRIKCLAVHPTDDNTVYAGAASGGVWRTTDAGQTWRPLWDTQESLAIGSIAIALSDTDTIYAGTGEGVIAGTYGSGHNFPGAGVYVSTDAGVNWTQRRRTINRRITRVLVSQIDATRVYVAGQSGFELSTDAGVTWTTLRAGQISDAAIDPNDPDTLYICVQNDRIYKTTDGGTTWTPLNAGPTGGGANWLRIAVGDNGASGSNFLVVKSVGTVSKSTDGGTTWTTIAGSHGSGWTGWCDLIAVAPDDENVFIAGGVWLDRTTNGGTTWVAPAGLHADQQSVVFSPSSPNIVYASNDGGVYRSTDKGATWKMINHGLVVTQFYDVGSWSDISTVLGGGTQDVGTNMTTGGLTWRNINGGDGGYMVIHPTDPRTMYAEFQGTVIRKSADGGNSWLTTTGLTGGSPWTGVITMDPANPLKLFAGTQSVFRTLDGCLSGWTVSSQSFGFNVSSIAISVSNTNRVYAGTGDTYSRTGQGRIFRSNDGGATLPWADMTTATLPSTRPVMDIAVDSSDHDRVFVAYGGTNAGPTSNSIFVSTNGGTTWTDISTGLPIVSVNAIALDPNDDNTVYVGTDVGVYRTTDLGVSWQVFDNGIPNVVISDLHIDPEDNALYASTFGRGMYKLNIAPGAVEPSVDLYLRDSILDVGERFPSPSGKPNPNDTTDSVFFWESPEIKVEVTPFYVPDAVLDGVEFDEDIQHDDPKRAQVNRFYLQVHNRGWRPTTNVSVRAFFADASAGLPNLPNPFVAPAFNLTSTVDWTPIGAAQNIPLLEPNRPVIVSWDWTVPMSAATHSCLLAVVSSADDPITTTETNIGTLITMEKRVCLKNLHVISGPSPMPEQKMVAIKFHNALDKDDLIDIIIAPQDFSEGVIGMLLEPVDFADPDKALREVEIYDLRKDEDIGTWYDCPGTKDKSDRSEIWDKLDRSRLYEFNPVRVSELRGIKIAPKQTIQAVITCKGARKVPYGQTQKFAVMQRQDGTIVGGSTYELRLKRAKGLHPVSRIRVILEKVRILNDREPWFKGRGDFNFTSCVSFNKDRCRRHWVRVPQKGNLKISDSTGTNEFELNVCVFDGYVAEKDNMSVSLLPIEDDWLDPDDELSLYRRDFSYPPETWVGSYAPGDEAFQDDVEIQKDWMLWYRIESVKL